MKAHKLTIKLLIGLLLITACGKSKVSLYPDEIEAYVANRDNGFIETREISNFFLELKYLPIGMVSNRIVYSGEGNEGDQKVFDSVITAMQHSASFTLRVETPKALENYLDREQLQQFVSEDMRTRFYLEDGDKKIPCRICHFERTYGAANAGSFNLYFQEEALPEKAVFVFDDEVLGLGPVNIQVALDELENRIKILPL
ncbi:hypothetical protein GC194_02190 [bacterium]|nr:hypothetical protein [bacterium]